VFTTTTTAAAAASAGDDDNDLATVQYWTNAIGKMNLSAPTTITLRRPSADADLIISRHDDDINSSSSNNNVTQRQISYSEPGSAEESSAEGSHSSLLDCGGLEVRKRRKKKKANRSEEESWKSGMRRASDCLRDVIKRCQQQLLCNDNKSKVWAMHKHGIATWGLIPQPGRFFLNEDCTQSPQHYTKPWRAVTFEVLLPLSLTL